MSDKPEASQVTEEQVVVGWIPCDERLPDFDVPVWLFDPEFGPFIGGRCDDGDGWLWANSLGTIWWNKRKAAWDADLEMDDDYHPTHWMPLPNPPSPNARPVRTDGPPRDSGTHEAVVGQY